MFALTPRIPALVSSLRKRVLSIHFLSSEPRLAAVSRHQGELNRKTAQLLQGATLEIHLSLVLRSLRKSCTWSFTDS